MEKKLEHCYIVPMSPQLRRIMNMLRECTVRQLLEVAMNSRTGTRPRVAREAQVVGLDANDVVIEIVLSLNEALNKAYPELMEDARDKRVVDVSFNQRQMIVVMRPADDRRRLPLPTGENDG